MRKTVLYVAAWLVGGALAVALATAGVSAVGNQVTGSRPSPLSATEVREELAATTTTTSAPGSTSTDTTGTTTSVPSTDTTTAAPSELRTYPMVGGTATLRFTPAGVTVESATPNPGFSVELEPTHGNGVKVEFEADHHKSKVEAWWDGGPREEVREDADSDDGHRGED